MYSQYIDRVESCKTVDTLRQQVHTNCMNLVNEKEKKVLGVLYKLGDASIRTLSKETLINRTALYHTTETLLEKGLVTKIEKDSVTFFQALPFSAYEDWAQKKITSISKETTLLKQWLQSQEKKSPSLYSEIRYFEGRDGVEHLYADTWRDNPEKLIRAITDYDSAYKVLNDFAEEYFIDRIENNVRVKNLLPKDSITGKKDLGRKEDLMRDMRFLDIFKDLGIEINIYGNKVGIVAFDEQKPTGVIIKNDIIAEAFVRIFEYLWKTSKKQV